MAKISKLKIKKDFNKKYVCVCLPIYVCAYVCVNLFMHVYVRKYVVV